MKNQLNTLPTGNENSRFIEIYVTDEKQEFSFYEICIIHIQLLKISIKYINYKNTYHILVYTY